MKYYLIAGEASGDLHASHLMQSLKKQDADAQFRFFGGDLMAAVGGTLVKHYRELAYMGFVPVLLHLRTILRNMKMCKQDIATWHPDVVILVDYPGFNLKIAKYVHRGYDGRVVRGREDSSSAESNLVPPYPRTPAPPKVYYYISPKIWAWKEYRIKNIRRDVDELFSILPFEVEFFEKKHHYPIHYVGNPTADEVREFLEKKTVDGEKWMVDGGWWKVDGGKPIVALLAGSRRQEIKDNLPAMVEVSRSFPDYQFVVAGAPGIDEAYYEQFLAGTEVQMVKNQTYPLLSEAYAALVTSGTATLETSLFNVPQVVCYKTPLPLITGFLKRHLLKVPYVSLVNLIARREVVPELVADSFIVDNIRCELEALLPGGRQRERMLSDYEEVRRLLGESHAADEAASIMVNQLKYRKTR